MLFKSLLIIPNHMTKKAKMAATLLYLVFWLSFILQIELPRCHFNEMDIFHLQNSVAVAV